VLVASLLILGYDASASSNGQLSYVIKTLKQLYNHAYLLVLLSIYSSTAVTDFT